jgi:hypothetical protein
VADGESDGGKIEGEFFGEFGDLALVVDTFVEAAGKFWRDGLDGDGFVGDGGEDGEKVGGRLWRVGFVDRDFGDEVRLAFLLRDVAVDAAGFLDGG